jgi:CheY-like chemotaxis protein
MQGFQQAADVPERLRDVFSALAEQLEARHVTSVYSVESPDLLGPVIEAPLRELSATTQNIVLMRHVEQAAQHVRLISVLKLRDSAHDMSIREFRITEHGIHIAKADAEGGARTSRLPPAFASTGARSDRPPSMLVEHAPRSERLRRPPVPFKGSVLIVDDEFGLAELISEILTDRGYSTTIAINGELGLAAMEEAAPDLILLDVMMPVVDGAEMARRVRANPTHASIPIVFMTALPGSVPRDQPPLHSAVLHKPFSSEQLFRVIEQVDAARHPTPH